MTNLYINIFYEKFTQTKDLDYLVSHETGTAKVQKANKYNIPIIKYGEKFKYAVVTLSFSVNEITPFSASILPRVGQFRS